MTLDPLLLSRIQFGFTVSFHIIFPTMSIGLALFLATAEGMWLRTRDEVWLRIYRFWLVIFALGFGVGVVTGIVLSFQFGTNFARFAQMAGPVLGPMIGLEVLSSFFLEAGFLGIMLFGMGRVGPKLHFAATCLVAAGTVFSASWILSANSWMQTPDGFALEGGRFVVTDWWRVIFNPSYLYRLPHMLMAAYLSASFFVAGVAAWYMLRGEHLDFARRTFRLGLAAATVLICGQVFLGDVLFGVITEHQPAKEQAVEGFWEPRASAPYNWIVVPDQAGQRNRLEIGMPLMGSILVTHSLHGTVSGLKQTPPDRQPNMALVFYGFRVMFGIAILMFGTVAAGLYLHWRGRLNSTRWFQRLVLLMTPSGFLATLGGWYTAEIGRQPFVVYGQLRTADALSPVTGPAVLSTLVIVVVVYALFLAGFLALALRHIARGPAAPPSAPGVSGSLKRALMGTPVSPGAATAQVAAGAALAGD